MKKIFAGHSFKLRINFFEDDGTTPRAVAGTKTLVFCDSNSRTKKLMTVDASSGLTDNSTYLLIDVSKQNNKLIPGTVYIDVHLDYDSTHSKPVQYSLTVLPSRARPQ